jgi:cob(I)alamin adenosyltransferase
MMVYIFLMSIVTKKGDGGKTRLLSGEMVSKYHPKVEACGDLDELNSFLGASRALIDNSEISEIIYAVQQDIFILSAEAACDPDKASKLKDRISDESIKRIENLILKFEDRIGPLTKFVVPGNNLPTSFLHISRTIARRAERKIAKLIDDGFVTNNNILIYLNRLSDLLYLLASRFED